MTRESEHSDKGDVEKETGKPEIASAISATKDVIATLRDATIIIAIYLYYAGFSYLHYYYNDFNIDSNILDLPVYYVVVFATNPVRHHGRELILELVLLVMVLYGLRLVRRAFSRGNAAASTVAGAQENRSVTNNAYRSVFTFITYPGSARIVEIGIVIIFSVHILISLAFYGLESAHRSAQKVYDAPDAAAARILLTFKGDREKSYPSDLSTLNRFHQLWFFAESKDALFLIGPACDPKVKGCTFLAGESKAKTVNARPHAVFRVAKADVSSEMLARPPAP